MEILLEHANSLVFVDKNKWLGYLSEAMSTPKVVLISAWQQDDINSELLEPLVKKLIDLGCGYFICAGKFSENLHDFIDDEIIDMAVNDVRLDASKVITTWHDAFDNDEVANYFLNLTGISNGLFIAFLDENRIEDKRLKTAILNIVST